MQKWEYTLFVAHGSEPATEIRINDMGKQGWELVSVLDKNDIKSTFFFFKRPLPSPILND